MSPPIDERKRWKKAVEESTDTPAHTDYAGVATRLPSSWRPPPASLPPNKHRLLPALSYWAQTRGKVIVAVIGCVGTSGTLFSSALAAYLHYAPDPHEDRLARMEAMARSVELSSRVVETTVGSITPRLERLEVSDRQQAEMLASLGAMRVQNGKPK